MKFGNTKALVKIKSGLLQIVDGINELIDPSVDAVEGIAQPGLIQVKGMEADWVIAGLRWDGKHEARDEKELTDFLGFNPNDATGGKSWCAGFWMKIFEELGFDVSGLNLMATSFKNFGYDLLEKYDSNSMPNGAILVFEPSEDAAFPIRHVGVKVDDDKLFGGNQGDSARRNNLAWYMANSQLTAARCPDGYELLAA